MDADADADALDTSAYSRALENDFVAIASHELRTPLTVLLGYLEMLQRRLPPDDEASQRYASRALAQTRRLTDLISNLLDASRLQHGKMQLALAPVELRALVSQVVDVARSLTVGQLITFEETPASATVMADAGRLEQVVMNLLTNAIKHASDSDRIDVRLATAGSEAVLEVQDHGPGIPARYLPNLFSRFFQVEEDGPRGTGLGLGLFISSEIVRAHGGTLGVRSVEGAGATFSVRLPLAP